MLSLSSRRVVYHFTEFCGNAITKEKEMTTLSRKLGACSVAAGAAVVGVGAAAQGAMMVFDYTASPLVASTSTSPYGAISEEIAVLYMDGTYKYAAGGTTYDQSGVTTPIVAGDQTTDSVWFGVHDFTAPGSKGDASGYTGVFVDPGDGGIVGYSITGDQGGNPVNVVTPLFDGNMVDGSLSFETDAGAVVRGVGGRYPPGWGGNTNNEIFGIEGQGYLGFYLDEMDGRHYGWAEVSLPTWGNPFTVTIHRWAYQTTPGAAAEVGIPEPMTLSMLALGASGLLARRRKK